MFGSSKQKIRVDIITGYLPRKKNCVIEEGQVIIQQGHGKGATSYKAKFDNSCLIPYKTGIWPFRSVKHKLFLKEGAFECVSFSGDNPKAPQATTGQVRKFATATVINRAGNIPEEKKTILYLLIGANIVLSFITLLVASGNLRF